MKQEQPYVIILAGGKGSRLHPMTQHRAKPAVPFAGYRVIDFVLNNLRNSGYHNIGIATQYLPDSLENHLDDFWRTQFGKMRTKPAIEDPNRERMEFSGTADAAYHVLQRTSGRHDDDILEAVIERKLPSHTLVFGGDHVYFMDVAQFEDFHLKNDADLTISAIPVPIDQARGQFGVISIDKKNRIIGFEEKPQDPAPIPGRPGWCLASMGNYAFKTNTLLKALYEDSQDKGSSHDFGKDIIHKMRREGKVVYAYDFSTNAVPGVPWHQRGYWRDVGTIREFFNTVMDLLGENPAIDLYNREWPMITLNKSSPPAKYIQSNVVDAMISNGSVINRADISKSVIGPKTSIDNGSNITNSFLMGSSTIGANCQIQNAIIDKKVNIPANTRIGYDLEYDQQLGLYVSEGITIVPRSHKRWNL